jgi:hypothetical protein
MVAQLIMVRRFVYTEVLENYDGGSIATGRAPHERMVKA